MQRKQSRSKLSTSLQKKKTIQNYLDSEFNTAIGQHIIDILDGSQDLVFVHNKNMEIIYANKAYLSAARVKLRDIYGKKYWQVFPESKGPFKCCKKVLKNKKMATEIYRCDDGTVYLNRTFPVLDKRKYLFSVHILENITQVERGQEQSMERLKFQQFIAKITKKYTDSPSSKLGDFIQKVLREIGKFIEVDRTCVSLFSEDRSNIRTAYEWVDKRKGIAPLIKVLQHIPAKQYPWFVDQVLNTEMVMVSDVDKLPKEAEKEKQAWKKIGYKSLLLVPLIRQKQHIGFVCFDMFRQKKEWEKEDIKLLHIVSDLISQALIHKEDYDAIQYRIKFELFISNLSKKFAAVDPLKIDVIINKVLKEIGKFVEVDRTCVSLFSEDMSNIRTAYEWVDKRKGIAPLIKVLQHIPAKQYPWFVDQVLNTEIVMVPDVDKLPKEAEKEKQAWQKIGYKSLLLVPLIRQNQHIGFVCFDMFKQKKEWEKEDIKLLHIVSDLISQALIRKEDYDAIQYRIKFELFISNLSKEFAAVDPLKINNFIKKALKEIGKFVEVDRTCVSLFSEDMSNIRTAYEWVDKRRGIAPLIKVLQHIPAKQYPWFVDQVLHTEMVMVPDVDKLPKEAEKEKQAWQKIGYKSLLLVPLIRQNQHIGFVCFDMFKQKKEWKREDIKLLHIVSDLISQALIRKEDYDAIQYRIKFELFISNLSKKFAAVDPLKIDSFIKKTLKDIGKFVEVDRTCVSLFSEDRSNIRTAYEWVDERKGIAPLIKVLQHIPAKQYPWFVDQVLSTDMLMVPDVDKLPKEAEKEKQAWQKIGYKSLLLVPLIRRNQHIGFVCFDMFKQKKEWRAEDINLLKIISHLVSEFLIKHDNLLALIRHEQEAVYISRHDYLTDLPNRLAFREACERELFKAKRFNRKIALLLFDIDHFKNVNDVYGHDVGDLLLQQAAKRLTRFCRKEDFVARLGGDEFAIIITDVTTTVNVAVVANKLMELFKDGFELNEHSIVSGTSIGISIFPRSGTTWKELYKNADVALYRAKQAGGNRYQFSSEEYNES
ncbi:MAG: diguanylate cyclase [Gammaproteobacteria bacterium]|jgi:diguanylate cyclase (GGDEF)-like protein